MTTFVDNSEIAHTLSCLQDDVFSTAENSGWHDKERSFGDVIALIHSELSEALEEYRATGDPKLTYYRCGSGEATDKSHDKDGSFNKTEGVGAELADVIIRILDAAGEFDIPVLSALMHKIEYNRSRPYRHGGKVL